MHKRVSLKKKHSRDKTVVMVHRPVLAKKWTSYMTIRIRHTAPSDLASIQAISDAAYGVYVAAMGQKPSPMLADYIAHLADGAVLVAVDSSGTVRGYAVMLDRSTGSSAIPSRQDRPRPSLSSR